MVLTILKILLFIILFLLIILVIFLMYPLSYQLELNTDSKKIKLKISPNYFNFILNKISKMKQLKNNMAIVDKFVDVEGVVLNNVDNENTDNSNLDNDKIEIEKQINQYKKVDNKIDVTPKSLIKDSVKLDKKISEDKNSDNDNIVVKLNKLYNKLYSIYNKTTDKDIKKLFIFTLNSIKKILINKKTKIYTDLVIGMDDPFTMGQILSVLSILYVYNGDSIKIEPHFDKNILNGNIKIIGKIYLMQIVILIIKILFHKGFKKLIKK